MKNIIFTFLLVCFRLTIIAQTSNPHIFDLKKMVPSSPDAAMLGRFGDIPVGMYTGTANIEVPLYTFKVGNFDLPLTLKYHSSGIKVQDEAGWVGLGWSLEPAGSIVHVVNGRDDDLDHIASNPSNGYEYLKENMLLGNYSSKYTDNNSQALTFAMVYGDGQPDYYHCSLPGFSAKFYINPENGEVVIFNKTVDASIVNNGHLGWTVTTIDGTQYILDIREAAKSIVPEEVVGSTWKLTKIKMASGREIDFEYSDGTYYSSSQTQTWNDPYPFFGGGSLNTINSTTKHEVKYLKRIVSGTSSIDFALEDRVDLNYIADHDGIAGNGINSTKRLHSLTISDTGSSQPIKSFLLAYDYFDFNMTGGSFLSNTTNYDAIGKRLKLLNVREVGYDELGASSTNHPHSFEYEEGVTLPLKTSYARDFWGYYNGANNSTFLPNLSYYLFSGYPEYQNIPLYVLNSYGIGANRSVNTSTVQAGMLKKVIYPTKGSTVFEYESNSFSNHNYPDVAQISASTNTAIAEDKNIPNDGSSRKQFSIPNSLTVNFVVTFNRGPNQGITFSSMLPSTVTLTRIGNGGSNITPIKTWQMESSQAYSNDFNADGMVTWNENIELQYVPNTYYVLLAGLPDALGVQNTSTNSASVSAKYTFTYMINTAAKRSNGGGVRIANIKNYDSDGALLGHKYWDYTKNGVSTGKLMSPLKHFFSREMHFSRLHNTPGTDQFPQGMVYAENTTQNIWFVSADGHIPFSDAAQGNLVGYSTVREVNADIANNGSRIVNYFNEESDYKINNPNVPKLRNGLLVSEEIIDANNVPVSKSSYSYIEKEAKFFRGFKVYSNFYGSDPPLVGDPGYGHIIYPANRRYTIDSYPNNAQWFVLESKKDSLFSVTGSLGKTELYGYNTLGQLISTKSYNSKGQEVVHQSKYTNDVPNVGNASVLRSRYQYDKLFETVTTIDGIEHSRNRYHYALFNVHPQNSLGQVLLQYAESANDGNLNSLREDYRVHAYGEFGVPMSITEKEKNTVLLWSYNARYPVAEIQNANYSTVLNALGGNNVIQNFSLSSPSDVQLSSFENSLRTSVLLKDAHVKMFTHRPFFGITRRTDEKGMTAYYGYDPFGRLKHIKDQDGNIVKDYSYNYKQ